MVKKLMHVGFGLILLSIGLTMMWQFLLQFQYVFFAIVIAGGIYLIWRAFRKRKGGHNDLLIR